VSPSSPVPAAAPASKVAKSAAATHSLRQVISRLPVALLTASTFAQAHCVSVSAIASAPALNSSSSSFGFRYSSCLILSESGRASIIQLAQRQSQNCISSSSSGQCHSSFIISSYFSNGFGNYFSFSGSNSSRVSLTV